MSCHFSCLEFHPWATTVCFWCISLQNTFGFKFVAVLVIELQVVVANILTQCNAIVFFAGFDRLPPGATPLDHPHLIEMQRRYLASLAQPGAALPPGHIPGVYPPASLASDLIARERERMERIGKNSFSLFH